MTVFITVGVCKFRVINCDEVLRKMRGFQPQSELSQPRKHLNLNKFADFFGKQCHHIHIHFVLHGI
jgi:hypothetical protein